LFFKKKFIFSLSSLSSFAGLSLSSLIFSGSGDGGRRWRHRAGTPKTAQNQSFLTLTPSIFSCLFRIQSPNHQETHQSAGSKQNIFEEKSLFSRLFCSISVSELFLFFCCVVFLFLFLFGFGLWVFVVCVFCVCVLCCLMLLRLKNGSADVCVSVCVWCVSLDFGSELV
jgi:hypothetical protein